MGSMQDHVAGYARGTPLGRLKARSGVYLSLSGGAALIRNFELLPLKLQRKVARSAVTKVARQMVKVVKMTLESETPKPIDSGLLKKSIGFRPWTSKTGQWAVGATLGPRKGMGRRVIRLQNKGDKGKTRRQQIAIVRAGGGSKPVYADPVKYAHLVEGGATREKHGMVKPRRFMEHSMLRSKDVMAATLRTEIANGIEREARKLAKR